MILDIKFTYCKNLSFRFNIFNIFGIQGFKDSRIQGFKDSEICDFSKLSKKSITRILKR